MDINDKDIFLTNILSFLGNDNNDNDNINNKSKNNNINHRTTISNEKKNGQDSITQAVVKQQKKQQQCQQDDDNHDNDKIRAKAKAVSSNHASNDNGDESTASITTNKDDHNNNNNNTKRNDVISQPCDNNHHHLSKGLLNAWKPTTSYLLLQQKPSLLPSFDIIDHVFGDQFNNDLKSELQQTGIFHQLLPSKTAMDTTHNNHHDTNSSIIMKQLLSFSEQPIQPIRGDNSVFISRSYRSTPNFKRKHPKLYHLLSSTENAVQQNLSNSTKRKIIIHQKMTSMQVASYAGDGLSGYARHCDRGVSCREEQKKKELLSLSVIDSTIDKNNNTVVHKKKKEKRIITAIYYLTDQDWEIEKDGGCLRVYYDNNDYHDIVPFADRFVLFRSDLVEHEVLPSKRRPRIAITIWMYGNIVTENDSITNDNVDNNDDGKKADGFHTTKIEEKLSSSSSSPPLLNKAATEILEISAAAIIANENNNDNIIERQREQQLKIQQKQSLPVNDIINSTSKNGTIFVSIPSYRDTETFPTINSLYENALYPNNIYVGIVFQYDTRLESNESQLYSINNNTILQSTIPQPWINTHIRTIVLDYRDATGPCYARALGQSLYRYEDYILQIDSHMRFRKNWDVYCISQLLKCPTPKKSVLTTYPQGYTLNNNLPRCSDTRGTILAPWKFDSNNVLRQKGRLLIRNPTDSDNNIPCTLYAGGFNFSYSSVIFDCPYDMHLPYLFFGEELSMAVRLYTHGYNLFAPPETVCYHLWTRDHRPTFQVDIGIGSTSDDTNSNSNNNTTTSATEEKQVESNKKHLLRMQSLTIVKNQLLGTTGVRGLGSQRSVQDFQDILGVDFKKGTINPCAENIRLNPNIFVSNNSTTVIGGGMQQQNKNNDNKSDQNHEDGGFAIGSILDALLLVAKNQEPKNK